MDLFEKCHNEFMQMVEGLKKDNIYCTHCGKTDKEEIVQNKFECHGYNR